jgi:FMN phosphatase YigB (HAD superfamily)
LKHEQPAARATAEHRRLNEARARTQHWRRWGPYLSERQWGHRPLDAAIDSAGLQGLFELRLSTDTIRTYKPDPRAYQLGVDAFGLGVDEIGFVASGGWDAAEARAFGYRTFLGQIARTSRSRSWARDPTRSAPI